MKKILILYPEEFNCQTKFDRKINNIVKNLDEYTLIFMDDYKELIKTYSEKYNAACKKVDEIDYSTITHAIVFDDGEVFKKELDLINSFKIPKRLIKILITRVINIKDNDSYKEDNDHYEYIGRGSYWGNPYSMFDTDTDSREEVIHKFEYDFEYDMFLNKKKNEVYKLAGKRLGCFCKPHACHGDVLADFLNSYDDGK